MTIEVYINSLWHELTPIFDDFTIGKKRDDVNKLRVRTVSGGNLKLYDADYDLLLPYLNIYNIECRVTETVEGVVSIYDAYLNLNNSVDYTTDFIQGNITIIDEYYNILDKPIYNADYKYNIFENVDKYKLSTLYRLQAQPYILPTEIYTPFAYRLRDIIEYIVGQLDSSLTFSLDFIDDYYNEILITEENLISGTSYFQNRDSILQDKYGGLPSEVDTNNRIEENLKLSLNELLEGFINLDIFWYIENGIFYLKPYKDYIFTNDIDLTANLNEDWENEDKKIVENKKDKNSIIEYTNDETIFIGYNDDVVLRFDNYNTTKQYQFSDLRYNKKEVSFPFTVRFNDSQKQFKEKFEDYYESGSWRNNMVGNLLTEATAESVNIFEKEIRYYEFWHEMSVVYEDYAYPIQNGSILGKTDVTNFLVNFSSTTRYLNISYQRTAGNAFDYMVSKWFYLSKDEIINILFTNTQSQIYLKCFLKDSNDIIIDSYNCDGSVNELTTIPANGYYYIEWRVGNDFGAYTINNIRILSTNRNYKIIDSQHFANNVYYYTYNDRLSLLYLLENFASNFAQETGILEDIQTGTSQTVDLIKENDRFQTIIAPINKNFANILPNKLLFTSSLGWARVDNIERTYNDDYNSHCTISLSTNKTDYPQ